MLYQITDGTVSAGGKQILSHIDFDIHGTERIALVGRNGAGKTTLLQVIAGERELDRDDRRQGPGIRRARALTIGFLKQQTPPGEDPSAEEEILSACPWTDPFSRERYAFEQESYRMFTALGFSLEDRKKKLSAFSGGERTKIRLIRLLLEKPDILLLDEPTNHLDMETSAWLEDYLIAYPKAVVMVSHDRFFLDQTAQVVYELEQGRLTRFPGNYTHYKEEKVKEQSRREKAWKQQQEELERLEGLVRRFKNKPRKAAFARAKARQLERISRLEKPQTQETGMFTGPIEPAIPGSKWVAEAEHLKMGYDKPLLELSLRIRRGQKIGLIGPNGAGKTTFLKTVAGLIPPLDGKLSMGVNIVMGYFDQMSGEIRSEKTVIQHFHDLFPSMTEKEARSILGAYLFSGAQAQKRVSDLSGGEKARLVLAELLQSRPNFLILDEPTNHMDIQAKEVLESAFRAYTGTILFVSHDRYFIRQVADSILIFQDGRAMYYPFGYEHYLEKKKKESQGQGPAAQMSAEDQALVAGLRAVPKGERPRLREISTEQAYLDWRLAPVRQQMEEKAERWERLHQESERLEQEWKESREYWEAPWEEQAAYPTSGQLSLMREQEAQAWCQWHERCLEWWDSWNEDRNED